VGCWLGILGARPKKLEIVLKDVFDAEEDVSKSGAPHERGESFSVIGDR